MLAGDRNHRERAAARPARPLGGKFTYRDYAALPEGAPYQLIAGELVLNPSPAPYHQRISKRLGYALIELLEEHALAEVLFAPIDVYLTETDTFQPDIIVIKPEHAGIVGEKKIEGAPDLIVEILSPSTARYDRIEKPDVYAEHGVGEYWIVDPGAKSVELFVNRGGKFELLRTVRSPATLRSPMFSDLAIDLATIF